MSSSCCALPLGRFKTHDVSTPPGFASSLSVFCSRPSSTSPAPFTVVFLEFVSLPSFLQLLSLVMNRLSVHVHCPIHLLCLFQKPLTLKILRLGLCHGAHTVSYSAQGPQYPKAGAGKERGRSICI